MIRVSEILEENGANLGRCLVQDRKAGAAALGTEVAVLLVGTIYVIHAECVLTRHQAKVLRLVPDHLGVRGGEAAATKRAVADQAPGGET